MPGTHDLLAAIGECMCILIDKDSIEYEDNLDEMTKLSNLNIEYSMNLMRGISNFMNHNEKKKIGPNKELVKIVYKHFHGAIFKSIYEWKSLNHSFNLKIVSLNSLQS